MRAEYKWSHEYSRSVGVDVRYILWIVGCEASRKLERMHCN